jgi:outer membrane protein W
MKIKILALSLIFSIPFFMTLKAQSGSADIHLNLGYGFIAAPQYYEDNTATEDTHIPYSYGSGANVDLGFNYMIGDHLGAGLDLNYLAGTTYTHSESVGNLTIDHTSAAMMVGVTPMLILSANHSPINPYGHFGVTIGSASFTDKKTETGNNAKSGTDIDTYSGGAAVGIYGAFGVSFALSDMFKLNVELFDRSMTYSPDKLENTQAYDGNQKATTITFVDKKDNTTANDTRLREYFPFSSFGLKVGFVYQLSSGASK